MATKKTTKNGLLSGRDDDFGVFLSKRIEEQERAKKGLPNAQVHDTEAAIAAAVEAIRILIRREKEQG